MQGTQTIDNAWRLGGYEMGELILLEGGTTLGVSNTIPRTDTGNARIYAIAMTSLEAEIARRPQPRSRGHCQQLRRARRQGQGVICGDGSADLVNGAAEGNDMLAAKSVAGCTCSTCAAGLFDAETRAANNANWRIAA